MHDSRKNTTNDRLFGAAVTKINENRMESL